MCWCASWCASFRRHPLVAAWLARDGLIRNFTVVVSNIAEGATPAKHVAVLRPSAKFQVVERGDALYLDPQSYERYSELAGAFASLNPPMRPSCTPR